MTRVPIRQCAGCRRRLEQRAMARFVRSAAGGWQADPPGLRRPGRGAYLCSRECAQRVAKNTRYPGLASAGVEYGFKQG